MSRLRSLTTALGVTVLVVALAYLASTWGLSALSRSSTPSDSGATALPSAVENAPPSLGTTEQYGPLGEVSMVYAGTDVEAGLLTEVEHPWVAVGARAGDYRAISAPDLPSVQPGAVALSQAGDRLAWATGEGVEVYDPETDTARAIPLDGASRVGSFSPDGSLLTVHAGGLVVLDLGSGDVVAEAAGTAPEVVRRAAWRADGSAVDYGQGQDLVTLPVDGGEPTSQPSPFAEASALAWAPTGEQLVALEGGGVLTLRAAPADGDGRLGKPRTIDTSGISLDGLLGFSGDGTVAVRAYLLESGNIERILDVQLDGGAPVDVTTLPPPGENWRGSATLAVSGDALRSGSTDFDNEVWPWSYRARLGACVLVGLFGLGMWLTRRRRTWRRRR
jgi:hypothetical protein